ncbi:hypothetical protein CEF21_15010 [Bacillus sp. FJAT-42376]|uniref:hypothetical protein n=1 Tax=Bacillus sp. FJAT-42376 TaxID=2014076 RepID=UPI000F4DC146|nr:hypothetical protein [Bacillus sp. FJAT-42376]AZB43505.1 hypothetical protein CEF21_15010 [Bacillus sp. FJAT-42376]
MAKKTAATLISEVKAANLQVAQGKEQLASKKAELQAKLAESITSLEAQKAKSVFDVSDEAISKEVSLQREIDETTASIAAIEDREARMAFPTDVISLMDEALALTKQEAAAHYEKELPGVLSEINAAKRSYLESLAKYHSLHQGVRKQIIDAAREVGRDAAVIDFPSQRVIYFGHNDHGYSDGALYGIAAHEIHDASERGTINVNTK